MVSGGWQGRRSPHRAAGPAALLALALLSIAAGSTLHAETGDGQEAVDWPAVITHLRQQAYDRPGHAQTRQQLAVAYNNYGVELSGQGQWALAAQQFQEALRLDAKDQQVQKNFSRVWLMQGHEAYERRDIAGAVDALQRAIALNPELVEAYHLLGKIEYDRQRLKEAKAAWERVLALDPSQAEVAEQLSQVTEELPVESQFERLSQSYFDLRYEEHLERPVGFDIRDALITARRQVGSDFAYWPKYKLVVLIYSPEKFRQLREETPEWLGGQFDGKIRVPLPSEQFDQATVRNILFHEYTHALIHDLTKGRCPTWLNEGLAEYEGRTQASRPLHRLAQAYEAQQLIPWTELSDHISPALAAEEVGLAYEESYTIAAYLVNRYGFWRIRKLLQAIAGGQAWEEALAEGFRRKLPRLEADWKDSLPAFLQSAR
ncbi:MAG: tetratricopeptide repeat protein [Candidatus Omnitrophica bacterium]|nr:tetratricopeptide repeat protein [Candidatus Omnitrophota bacterium]